MSKLLWKTLLVGPAAVGAALAFSGAAVAAESISVEESAGVDAVEQVSFGQEPVRLAQVTSVQQLSDVSPADWAFQALQNLVDRYNCIQGYPDRTFRGNRSLTRYEFAAGLNACLDVIAQLIQTDAITREEFEQIRRLQEEFQAELNTLRGRVDALEADVAELEANQFSTTTKLRGQVDAHLGVPFDTLEDPEDDDSATFVSRARLNFDTSFTGEDRLRVRLQGSSGNDPLGAFEGFANASGLGGEGTLDLRVDDFYYSFPVGNRLDFIVAANSILTDDFVVSTIVPFDGPSVADAGGPLFYDVGMGGGAGLGVSFAITDRFVLDAGYSVDPTGAADPSVGIFQGTEDGDASQSYIAQLSYLGDNLQAAVAYLRGDGAFDFADNEPGDDKDVDTFAGLVNFGFGRFNIGGHIAYSDFDGGDDLSWTAGVAVDDLFIEGTQLGVYGGQLPQFEGRDDNPFLIEGYYEVPFNEFLTITPAIIYGDAGVDNADDDTVIYGVIRTTFRF